jgi:hypothetical protein
MIAVATLLALFLYPSGCPTLAQGASLPFAHPSDVIHTDIDGDLRKDVIGLAAAPFAPGSCGIFLVAETRDAKIAARIPGYYADVSATQSVRSGVEPPRLAGRFWLGSTSVVAVETGRGAHATFFALYRFWRGKLIRLSIAGRQRDVVGEDYGSTNFGGTYCRRDHLLVEWSASIHYPGRGYTVDFGRVTFRLAGRSLEQTRAVRRRIKRDQLPSIVRRGPAYTPFDGCRFSRR